MSEHALLPYENMLATYTDALLETGFSALQGTLDDQLPVNALLVPLNEDESLQLVAYFLGDLMHVGNQESVLPEGVDFLHLIVQFSYPAVGDAIPDLARLLHMLNWSIPVGVYGINESQNIVYYRHVFQHIDDPVSTAVFVEAVDTMAHYIDLHTDLIGSVAGGQKTLSEVLTTLEAEGRREEVFPGYDS